MRPAMQSGAPDLRLEIDRIMRLALRIAAARTNPVIVPTSTIPGQAPFRHEVDVLGPELMAPLPGETCDRHSFPSANGRCHGRCVDAVRPGCCAACLIICGALAAITAPRALEAA